jgi:hypothetical protein
LLFHIFLESTITWKFHWLLNKVKFDLLMAVSALSYTVLCMLDLLYNSFPHGFITLLAPWDLTTRSLLEQSKIVILFLFGSLALYFLLCLRYKRTSGTLISMVVSGKMTSS